MVKTPVVPAETPPSAAAVTEELDRIAASVSFRKADQCVRLLRYITTSALEGRAGELKEYSLGVSVFARRDSYDPRIDPIVRSEARRLRLKLSEYYRHEGSADPVVIDLPKGAYVPAFRLRTVDVPSVPEPARRSVQAWLIPALLALMVLIAAGYAFFAKPRAVLARSLIGVVGFQDLSSGTGASWVASAVSELLNFDLDASPQMRTAPLENVARMRTELSLTPQPAYAAGTLQQIRANLGIDYVVTGTYVDRDRSIHLDLTLFDARSGRQVATIGEDGMEDRLPDLAQRCAGQIRSRLGVRLAALRDAPPILESAAMEPYARGMEHLRSSDALSAQPYLEKAAAADPYNPLIHSGLAAAWSMLGRDDRALQEAKLAFDSSSALGRVDQLEIEGRYRGIAHDWPRAIQVYQALVTLIPDDLEFGLLLANAETRGGKAQDALTLVSALRRLPRPIGNDPRIDLAEAQSAGALADYAHTLRAAHAAAEKAGQHGARLQYARARLLESGAMQNLDVAGFADVRAEARGICAELGDRACVAAAYRIEANALASSGSPAKARTIYATVLEIANEIGNQLEKLNALTGLAYTENLQGDLKAAEADDRAALAVASELAPQKKYAASMDLAEVLAEEGRVAESRSLGQEALNGAHQVSDQQGIGLSEALLAHLLAVEGKFPESLLGYKEAVRILRDVGSPVDLATTLLDFGDAQMEAGDTAGARMSYEEVRDLDRQHGDFAKPEVAMAFARLNLAAGKTEDAASGARAAMNAFAAAGREGDRLRAATLLASALIARGNRGEAAQVIAQIPSPDGRPLPIDAAVHFRLARCLVDANAGRRAEADRAMDAITVEVSRLGLPPLEKETRLARLAMMKNR